eukprot:s241_g5.t1
MKAVKRGAGAGNKNPIKRNAFPDVNQDQLDEEMNCYIRSMGVAASFDVLEYKNLQGQQAEHPKSLFKLNKLLEAMLKVSPSGQIKYGQLRQSLQVACKKFGMELLSPHWQQVEHSHLPGRAADALGVLLKHWRRVTSSQTAWDKFGSKLEESHFNQLQRPYKMMKPEGDQTERPKRELTAHISDVTVDSKGLPAMLKTSSEEGDENSSDCDSKDSLMKSPPPVGTRLWRENAGKPLKKKPAKKVERTPGTCKRPATKHKPMSARLAGGATTKIHTASLSVGGGKNQAYIQHIPGPGTEKRLIVACTIKQAAALKISHKALIQELLPRCKVPGTTKGDILKARDGLFQKYQK